MKINSHTKISALIKENSAAIDAIASINPHFNKLRNPILRKVLASRVTIEDAARIGKCEVQAFFDKLSAIGFEIENTTQLKKDIIVMAPNDRITQTIQSGKIKSLDVRPSLAQGQDPFNLIMGTLKDIPDGYVLEIINTFEPTPLIKILKSKGYETSVETDNGTVKTYFLKLEGDTKNIENSALLFRVNISEFEKEKEKYSGKFSEIDVRDLEMPLPMVTILGHLEQLPAEKALFVHHKKVPQFLLPEMEERGFKVFMTEIEDGYVKLLIHK